MQGNIRCFFYQIVVVFVAAAADTRYSIIDAAAAACYWTVLLPCLVCDYDAYVMHDRANGEWSIGKVPGK